jgi:hypothetical protein
MAWSEPPDIADSTVLFRRSIPLDRPGKYFLRVLRLDGSLVAQTVVTATRHGYHPWMPLERFRDEEPKEADAGHDAVAHVRNRAKGIAIPQFEGMAPLLFKSDGPRKIRRLAEGRLPALVPAFASPGFTITPRAAGLAVESKERIVLARADWHFLVRWWVNGRPYVPQQIDSFMDQNGMVVMGRRLLLYLDFAPDRMGAKPGDDVELQLLYCKNGWQLVESGVELLSAHFDAKGPDLLLSNRIHLSWETNRKHQHDAPADADKRK